MQLVEKILAVGVFLSVSNAHILQVDLAEFTQCCALERELEMHFWMFNSDIKTLKCSPESYSEVIYPVSLEGTVIS